MKSLIFLLASLPFAAAAESVPPYPVNVELRNVISAVGPGPANGFKAVLLREGEFAGLYIFAGPYDRRPLLHAPQVALTGEHWGTIPWLEFEASGTLLVRSQNLADGRNKWEKTLSVIRRDGRFIISAFRLSAYDSLDPDTYTECEIDMLNRRMTINENPVEPFPLRRGLSVVEWSEDAEDLCTQNP